jgi:hypothetical protein
MIYIQIKMIWIAIISHHDVQNRTPHVITPIGKPCVTTTIGTPLPITIIISH